MESLGVLLTLPMNPYLEEELDKRCKLFRLWESPPESRRHFIRSHAQSIRAIVGDAAVGADADTIDALPKLEIVALFSVGVDKVDLAKCKEKGIRVTNTPDVLTDDVADLAIGLAIAVMRRICDADRYVRSGNWKTKGGYKLTTKKSKFIYGKLVNNGFEVWKLVTKGIIVYSIILLYSKLQQFSLDNDLLCINLLLREPKHLAAPIRYYS